MPCNLESESENDEAGDDEEPTFTDVIEGQYQFDRIRSM